MSEAVHRSAFKINASKKRQLRNCPALREQLMTLLGRRDVAGKQDYAARLQFCKQQLQRRCGLQAVEADDHQLAGLLP